MNSPSNLLENIDKYSTKFVRFVKVNLFYRCKHNRFSYKNRTVFPSCWLSELLFFLGNFFLVGFDDVCRKVLRHSFIVIEFHREVSATARHGANVGGVAQHLR